MTAFVAALADDLNEGLGTDPPIIPVDDCMLLPLLLLPLRTVTEVMSGASVVAKRGNCDAVVATASVVTIAFAAAVIVIVATVVPVVIGDDVVVRDKESFMFTLFSSFLLPSVSCCCWLDQQSA